MKTTPWEHLKTAYRHERDCQEWPHRLLRKAFTPFASSWNRWARNAAGALCDPYVGCKCRLCRG